MPSSPNLSARFQRAAMANDNLMRIQQSRNLDRNLFPASGRTLDACGLGHIRSHGKRDSAKQLNPFSDRVHDLRLLSIVLIEQEMKLIERRARNLPVRLFIEIARESWYRPAAVQLLRRLQSYWVLEFQR